MIKNLLSGIFHKNWSAGQDAILIIAIILAVIVVAVLVLYILFNTDAAIEKRKTQRARKQAEILEFERQALQNEKKRSEFELKVATTELAATTQALDEAELQAMQMREEMLAKQDALKQMFIQKGMTKREVMDYQRAAETYVAEDELVNALTDHVLSNCGYTMSAYYKDCDVPLSVKTKFTEQDVLNYINTKAGVQVYKGSGKNPTRYKVGGKVFVQINFEENGSINMAFKCGPMYGVKLISNLKDIISYNKFPAGVFWFALTNEVEPCSLELVKLLIDISYIIAKLGF